MKTGPNTRPQPFPSLNLPTTPIPSTCQRSCASSQSNVTVFEADEQIHVSG